ncbi:class Ia ribonucleoside-diphosphate reductase subunit beta [Ferrimonas marina]|uniref:ribonucleoside-diphosphate reductase n=1 Tax=Ferrimonas marina TaxID=299255 RepID=A0A1M5UI10_9GAMM|nr:class Ia ribonucleoside-diphosphate reductase subunit beta [Ferrimonas marina]SHH62607.1 ribonucleoside-diphosphate reductase beta chain [Ferrimonas marina]
MAYSVFDETSNSPLEQPMFLGQPVSVARYDQQRYKFFEDLIEKQMSFFWRPEEVDVSKDRMDFMMLPPEQRHIFTKNLQYQILLDSVQGRSPNVALLPLVSLPELETWIETWAYFETIHSRSYTHIIRNIVNDPGEIFDDVLNDPKILARAKSVTKHYDKLYAMGSLYNTLGEGTYDIDGEQVEVSTFALKQQLYLVLVAVNILEGIRFYVSFACSFAFAELELMEGNAKLIRLIARDEQLHLVGTQYKLNLIHQGKEGEEFATAAESVREEAHEICRKAAEEEKDWARYLFKDGSMIGVNEEILSSYIDYIMVERMEAIGFTAPTGAPKANPLPWMQAWLESDKVQVAPQEVEVSSYLTGQFDSKDATAELDDIDL